MASMKSYVNVPDQIKHTWDILQLHYNGYMDDGGSHAEYVLANTLSKEESDQLLRAYMKRKKERKR